MYVYRNIAWESGESFSGSQSRTECLEELTPEGFMLLESIPCTVWRTESEILTSVRSIAFFNLISDERVKMILHSLSKLNKIEEQFVITDLEVKPLGNDGYFSASTDNFPSVAKKG